MNLTIPALKAAYATKQLSPDALIDSLCAQIAQEDPAIWITRLSHDQLEVYLERLRGAAPASLPLYGIPFAIKDNIDLAGVPTTAACPAYAYTPQASAHVVQRLIEAGAIPLGKTNLDQFATGLVGTRSPYGVPVNAFNPAYISGGSSSGSAVAVAKGLVSFALGTDTAGSGRVPASFNNIVGLKPSCGLLSTSGVVPACRSLDCVSIFSLTAADAEQVLGVAAHFDPQDIFARSFAIAPSGSSGDCDAPATANTDAHSNAAQCSHAIPAPAAAVKTIGVPRKEQLEFFGDKDAESIFEQSVSRLAELGFAIRRIDFSPFTDAARLLYEGPWVAERYLVAEPLLRKNPSALLPVTRTIIAAGSAPSAADAFAADYRLRSLRRQAEAQMATLDAIVTPTAGTVYTIAQVDAEPIALNSNLGRYTNFMNLLDFAAVASPSGFRADGQPLGITFFAPAGSDLQLLELAGRYHASCLLSLGTGTDPVPAWEQQTPATTATAPTPTSVTSTERRINLVVCGAHMEGLALNQQLLSLGAEFAERTHTTPDYRFYRLPGEPARPALVHSPEAPFGKARPIEVEVWTISAAGLGELLTKIPAPLGLGKVFLADGRQETGFIADATAPETGIEITEFGGWRKYLASLTAAV